MNIPNYFNSSGRRQQRGAVLFVSLIFLILLTLLALTAASTSILQERMTGGMRNRQLSLIGAENGVRGGEAFLWKLSYNGAQPLPPCIDDSGSANCVYRPMPNGTLRPSVQTFRTSKSWLVPGSDAARDYEFTLTGLTGSAETASLSSQPRLMIENLGPDVPPGAGSGDGNRDGEKKTLAGKHEWYRITARSQGGTDAVVRAAESVYSAIDLTNTGFNPGAGAGGP
ncbi:MAG TPA: PilX N-terminal domain-containing pilus assembly protein [Dokdonella sp.]|nr:PilX N-terminal domain-containing pilus assembly protein [Dokdonella sp.]